jgi:protein-S-isoprenylcysteine O-methyltransferase Ste14
MRRGLIDGAVNLAKREHSVPARLLTLAGAGLVFVVIIPLALLVVGPAIDGAVGLPRLDWGWLSIAAGSLLAGAGGVLALWSVYVQITLGRGTPIPLVPTQKLIVIPPYTYCRNPMILGTITMYSGVAVVAGSIAALLLVMLGMVLPLTYVKAVEEKELAIRFGREYEDYRRTTPFILPRLGRRTRRI